MKLSLAAGGLLLLVLGLAGCGGSAGGTATTSASAPVTVKLGSAETATTDTGGDTVTLVATAYGKEGKPCAGVPVILKTESGDILCPAVTTDSEGRATFSIPRSALVVPREGGTVRFTAQCDSSSSNLLALAFGPSTDAITVSVAEDGSFVIDSVDMTGLYGIKFTVEYDASVYSKPEITRGSRMGNNWMMVWNATIPGKIIIAAICTSGGNDTGTLASIRFTGGSGTAVATGSVRVTGFEAVTDAAAPSQSISSESGTAPSGQPAQPQQPGLRSVISQKP